MDVRGAQGERQQSYIYVALPETYLHFCLVAAFSAASRITSQEVLRETRQIRVIRTLSSPFVGMVAGGGGAATGHFF
jgi:hypothetical protein